MRALSQPLAVAVASLLAGCVYIPVKKDHAALKKQVEVTERAFAKTMADRDHAAFMTFLAEEAVFFSGPEPLHGKAAVAAWWKRLYDKPDAPFSWEPEKVEVLESGTLALSTGPVRDRSGKVVATFQSIWRQESAGVWRIVFDKGCDACDCAARQ